MHKLRQVGQGKKRSKVGWSVLRHFVWEWGHYQRQRARARKYNHSVGGCPGPPSLPVACSTSVSPSRSSSDD